MTNIEILIRECIEEIVSHSPYEFTMLEDSHIEKVVEEIESEIFSESDYCQIKNNATELLPNDDSILCMEYNIDIDELHYYQNLSVQFEIEVEVLCQRGNTLSDY